MGSPRVDFSDGDLLPYAQLLTAFEVQLLYHLDIRRFGDLPALARHVCARVRNELCVCYLNVALPTRPRKKHDKKQEGTEEKKKKKKRWC